MADRKYPRRLIEVDLPIKRISEHARREKSIRHGHISTLHIWWARRPLAACRAVICASLWPDPADEICPPVFREVAFRIMKTYAREAMNNRTVRDELLSEYSLGRLIAVNKEDSNFSLDNPNALSVLRQLLLDFIADFANWDASTNELFLKTARELTQAAHEALGGELGTRPLVVDPFAGGGSIPLEALRVGADAFASDLNPVAVLLNKVVLEYIPKYGQQLADEVRKWGNWVKEEAEKELAEFYSKDPDGATPIAYLWARTIRCEGPSCGAEVPLMHSFLLAQKGKKYVYLNMKTAPMKKEIEFEIKETNNMGTIRAGTVQRSSAVCPICGYTTPASNVRAQFLNRNGGADTARLIAVVVLDVNGNRRYRLPSDHDIKEIQRANDILSQKIGQHEGSLSFIPNEELPYLRSIFNIHLLGVHQWNQLFTRRQILSMAIMWQLLRRKIALEANRGDSDFWKACATCISLAIDRVSAQNNSLSWWQPKGEFVVGAFGRQALGIIWDFAEIRPIAGASGDLDGAIEWVERVIENQINTRCESGHSELANAVSYPLPDDFVNLFFTDPPYYDAVPYADLSDFFYTQLKRMLVEVHPSLFAETLTPKEGEIVQLAERNEKYKFKTKEYFESNMTRALSEGRRYLKPDGLGAIIFAHKTTQGWEAMLSALIDAGWVTTASWPIDTERSVRIRAYQSAALGSSIHIACRPRENPDGSLRIDDIGDWRDILNELPGRIHEWMPRLAQEGVVGADAIFACLGPALEIFSRYSSVEKSSGEKVELKEYLEHVWAAVAREALNMIFEGADASGFEEDARLTAMWLWTLRTSLDNSHGKTEISEDEDEGEIDKKAKGVSGYSLEYDAARKIAQGLGAHLERLDHLVQIKGETATLLSVAARTRYLFGKDAMEAPRPQRKKTPQLSFDFVKELEEAEKDTGALAADISTRPGATVLDQVHQSMILFGAGRTEALKRLLVDEGVGRNPLFWRLAQSLSALYPPSSEEKRWIDGVSGRKKGLGL
jgi:putative DNA methylase